MSSRLDLQKEFKKILGNNNVYFQPPEDTKLSYPCIIFRLLNPNLNQADNKIYLWRDRYMVTIISKDPKNILAKRFMESFPHAVYGSRTISNNLYHDNLTLLR